MRIVIELDNIIKTYGDGHAAVRALRGVSIKIHAGEFVTIRGSSGSGKSTLMNILGCLDRPTSGAYYLDGENVQRMAKAALANLRNRKLGFVFQGFNLLKRMSAIDNVEMPLVYSGVSPLRRREKALKMLGLVGLKERAHHLPNQMSGGQQQRVAIARALVNDPQILFADEPTGNLDSATGTEILAEFDRLNRELGQTIVMVTHDPVVAERAPRQITVRDGVIAADIRKFPEAGAVTALQSAVS
ncbi:MAG TPA: ABC transporter ATP-binding protein [Gemmataceae bacterium]|nr:ABC transporter ATP-binding protein [Gemmataceae bacterium]